MNENEVLLRWLGFKQRPNLSRSGFDIDCWSRDEHPLPGEGLYELPEFRTSNEWAGALFERLGTDSIAIECEKNVWHRTDVDGEWVGPIKSWRDAVVDAALEIARRAAAKEGG